MKISNLPPKGTSDWLPQEYLLRKYIFNTWRRVCLQFGFEEYLTPIIESAEVYKAKSGEDVGGKELMTMVDRAGRELAIRPEMTPSVTRMVSRVYESATKPLRLFSIANFLRNEKPQKGRNREFWQLNVDIFGSESLHADLEILVLVMEIMKEFGATKDQFVVYLNDRGLIESFLKKYLFIPQDNISTATRILDKFGKISNELLIHRLISEALAKINNPQEFIGFLSKDDKSLNIVIENYLKDEAGMQRIIKISKLLEGLGYKGYGTFNPSMVRGFDYYDGLIFEVYDRKDYLKDVNHDQNVYRSLFGGGRYNGLANIFESKSFPAVGFAPGDETMKIFLEEYNLLDKVKETDQSQVYYFPLLDESLTIDIFKLATDLRKNNLKIKLGLEVQKLSKALDYANKINVQYTIILGSEEKEKGIYMIKDMLTGKQTHKVLDIS